MSMTITEGLAELKTLDKRIAKKRESIAPFLWRQEGVKDPIKDVGSVVWIQQERQAINDLEKRKVEIRTKIQMQNLFSTIKIEGIEKTVQEWLNWRKDVAPGQKGFIENMRRVLNETRKNAMSKGLSIRGLTETPTDMRDIVINVDEAELAKEAEQMETVLGTLDGRLSLNNATATIDV